MKVLNQDIITNETVIEIKNLRIAFKNQDVLKDVSLRLYKGENLVVLGKSGSGKSVLIKCIVALLGFDSGSINVLGQNLKSLNTKELNDLRMKIGFLFQSGALYDSLTVKQNLEFAMIRVKRELSQKQRDENIATVGWNARTH